MGELEQPSAGSYLLSVVFSSITKVAVIVLACIITAYQTELFFAALNSNTDGDQPIRVCFFSDEDYYGYRICNNSVAASIGSILICIALLVIDLLIPCANASLTRLAHFFNLIWSVVMAVYWLITAALVANLYQRYCDSFTRDCDDDERKFIVIPVLGFFVMVAWAVNGLLALIRMIIGK